MRNDEQTANEILLYSQKRNGEISSYKGHIILNSKDDGPVSFQSIEGYKCVCSDKPGVVFNQTVWFYITSSEEGEPFRKRGLKLLLIDDIQRYQKKLGQLKKQRDRILQLKRQIDY